MFESLWKKFLNHVGGHTTRFVDVLVALGIVSIVSLLCSLATMTWMWKWQRAQEAQKVVMVPKSALVKRGSQHFVALSLLS